MGRTYGFRRANVEAVRSFLGLLVFDLLSIDGTDLTHASQRDRRERLQSLLVPQPGRVELTAARLASSADEVRVAFREAMANHCEGLMIKGLTQPYVPGDRKAWLKLKKDYLSEAEAGSVSAETTRTRGAGTRPRPRGLQAPHPSSRGFSQKQPRRC